MKITDAFIEDYGAWLRMLSITQIIEAYDLFVRGEHEECKKYVRDKLGF